MEKDLQIVGFQVGRETYGLPIEVVREIIRLPRITAVPNVNEHIDGVINLRGRIVPVINLPRKFGSVLEERDGKNRVVVVELDGRSMGLIVHSATEVLRIAPSKIEKPDDVFTNTQATYISGVGKLNGRVVILVDLGKIVRETAPSDEKRVNGAFEVSSAVTVV